MKATVAVVALLAGLWLPDLAEAQSLGTFQWRLFPYCNTLTLSVIQEGSNYRLQGNEDLCESVYLPQPVSGTAVVAPDGSVIIALNASSGGGFSFTSTRIVARITLPDLNGHWNDEVGRGGEFALVASARASGTQRASEPLAFLHIVTAQNRRAGNGDNVSCFSHSLTDNNPTALISVTANRGTSDALRPFVGAPVSLYLQVGPTGLSGSLAQNVWCLSRDDSQTMPLGAGFTIHILSR